MTLLKIFFIVFALCTFCQLSVNAALTEGDIDGNGKVDLADIAILFEQWLSDGSGWSADVNNSSNVDLTDFAAVVLDWQPLLRAAPI